MAAKKTKKIKKSNTPFDFIVAALKRNPKAEYAPIRDAAEKKRITIYPIMYGRAKLLLGLVSAGKSTKKKTGTTKRATSATNVAKRGPGRPRKVSPPGLNGLEQIIAGVKTSAKQRDQYRRALEQIRNSIDVALG